MALPLIPIILAALAAGGGGLAAGNAIANNANNKKTDSLNTTQSALLNNALGTQGIQANMDAYNRYVSPLGEGLDNPYLRSIMERAQYGANTQGLSDFEQRMALGLLGTSQAPYQPVRSDIDPNLLAPYLEPNNQISLQRQVSPGIAPYTVPQVSLASLLPQINK